MKLSQYSVTTKNYGLPTERMWCYNWFGWFGILMKGTILTFLKLSKEELRKHYIDSEASTDKNKNIPFSEDEGFLSCL